MAKESNACRPARLLLAPAACTWLGLFPLLLLAARAESPSTASPADSGYIRLDVAVRDAAGEPIPGLTAGDFTLFDNGRATGLVSFAAWNGTPDAPVEAIFVIDTVNLPPEQVAIAQRALVDFLRSGNGRLELPMMIYRLTGSGLTRSREVTRDGNQLAGEAERGPGPVTVWQEALRPIEPDLPTDYASKRNAFSVSALGSIVLEARRRPGRKLLFWIGPGWQVRSGGEYTFEEVVELSTRMREARLEISTLTPYAYPEDEFTSSNLVLGLRQAKDGSPLDLMLEVLAIQSGGRALPPTFDLKGAIERALRAAACFYTLTFDPPRAASVDEYHALEVAVKRAGVAVRTRSGYYDQPVIYDQPPERKRLTFAGLKEMLTAARDEGDPELAAQLERIELTERMPAAELPAWMARMPGGRARSALAVVAGASAFRGPPPETVIDRPPPEVRAQQQMMARTVAYLSTMLPRLPNFYATAPRRTMRNGGTRMARPGRRRAAMPPCIWGRPSARRS